MTVAVRSLLLETESLSKQYDGRYALQNVDFDIMQGEVLALTGENGAGKSTLVRILTGVTAPDSGRVRMDGNEVIIRSPAHARKLGIAAVHQDFDLAPNMTVAENLLLGTEPQWLPRLMPGFINLARQHELALARLAAVGLNVDPDTLVAHLSVAERQLVAIAISIASPVRLLVLDEPTSSLAADDIEHLLGVIERQRDAGTAVLFISHKLHEVFRVADRICVFRDGRKVGKRKTTETGIPEIVSMMVGRELDQRDHRAGAVTGDVLLQVSGLRARRLSGSIDLVLRRGEILGIYGLKGSGRMELLRVLFGLQSSEAGEIRVEGRALRIRSPSDAIRCGIAWVCRDRKELGLFGNFNVRENLTVAALDSLATGGFVDRRAERQAVSGLIQRLAVKTAGPEQHITGLSGGNQQKVLLARWLLCHPRVLILDEPTVGIDIGARSEIHALMSELAGEGIGILLVSSELPEVLTLSDRVLVMHDGALAGELDRAEASEERVMQLVHAHNLPKPGQEQSPVSA